jgi:hypothetical protein
MAGEDVWIRWGPTGYGHGITCVGYDDNVGIDVNGDGKITNDIDINGDGEMSPSPTGNAAPSSSSTHGAKTWSKDGKIYLLYSAMVDPTWERGNYLGRVEVARHIPRRTLKLKLTCDNRADLRVTIGIARDKDATAPEHEFAPQPLNGWAFRHPNGPAFDTNALQVFSCAWPVGRLCQAAPCRPLVSSGTRSAEQGCGALAAQTQGPRGSSHFL